MSGWCAPAVSWSSFGCWPGHDGGQLPQRACRTARTGSINKHTGRGRRRWSLERLSFGCHARKQCTQLTARFLSGADGWSARWRSVHTVAACVWGRPRADTRSRRCARRESQLQCPRTEVVLRALRPEFGIPQFAGDGYLWALRVWTAGYCCDQGQHSVCRLPVSAG